MYYFKDIHRHLTFVASTVDWHNTFFVEINNLISLLTLTFSRNHKDDTSKDNDMRGESSSTRNKSGSKNLLRSNRISQASLYAHPSSFKIVNAKGLPIRCQINLTHKRIRICALDLVWQSGVYGRFRGETCRACGWWQFLIAAFNLGTRTSPFPSSILSIVRTSILFTKMLNFVSLLKKFSEKNPQRPYFPCKIVAESILVAHKALWNVKFLETTKNYIWEMTFSLVQRRRRILERERWVAWQIYC